MPAPDTELLTKAEHHIPADPGVRDCWGFIVEGIKLGWLDRDNIRELIGYLQNHEHYGLDELLFEEVGDCLRVSFLDDSAECASDIMINELERLVTGLLLPR